MDGCVSGGNIGVLFGLVKLLIVFLLNIDCLVFILFILIMNGKFIVMFDLGVNVEVN